MNRDEAFDHVVFKTIISSILVKIFNEIEDPHLRAVFFESIMKRLATMLKEEHVGKYNKALDEIQEIFDEHQNTSVDKIMDDLGWND